MEDFNPYQAQEKLAGSLRQQPHRSRWWSDRRYLLVFLVNLPVPTYLALMTQERRVVWGILPGLIVLFVGGRLICGRSAHVRHAFLLGCSLVALSQLFPVLQLTAGIFAILLSEQIGISGSRLVEDIVLGAGVLLFRDLLITSLATIITGGIFMGAGTWLGLAIDPLDPKGSPILAKTHRSISFDARVPTFILGMAYDQNQHASAHSLATFSSSVKLTC